MTMKLTRRMFNTVAVSAAAYAAVSGLPTMAAGKKIAVMPKTLINDVFQVKIAEAAEAEAKKLGFETERFASSSDVAVQDQINIIEALIARGEFGGIVLAASVAKGLGNVVRRAKEADIFVVLVDSKTDGDDFVTVIQTDNAAAAATGAEFSAKLIGAKGKVALLEGEPGGETAALRTKGFKDGVSKFKDIEIVSSITGHWTLPGGVEATEAIISAHKDLDLIFACSDMMGVGARQVLERAAKKAKADGDDAQAKKFEDVKIVGFDGVEEAVKQIWAGKFSGTVAQRPDIMGAKAVQTLAELINGTKKPEDFPKVIDSGMLLVTAENVDQYATEIGLKKS
ncbi:sugar ABC transporter substrate-binding protein [Rhizobium sp. 18055]|uniref:sugar ABC transporter substrate-binding protein n=1 Tax=Rhizobium sp. 18055 TaxID=2681403 RepID=UPI001359257F|nr:sugar ABC transporter substrate-binding protein [Rhizobium sp. 18055]